MILLLGNGFVGEALSQLLINKGQKVKVLSKTKGSVKGVEYRIANWKELHKHIDFFDNVDIVIQSIHTSVPYTSMLNIQEDLVDNVLPSIQLFEILKQKKIFKTIFISSGGTVYGKVKNEMIKENHKTTPISAYGVSKLTIEHYINLYNYNYGLNISIIRPSNLYGLGQTTNKRQGIIAHIIESIFKNKKFYIWGDGKGVKDYLYIDDFLQAINCIIEKFPQTPKIYNIASGDKYSVLELINIIETITETKLDVNFKSKQIFDVSTITLDATKFKNDFLWNPKIDIYTGVKKVINNLKC